MELVDRYIADVRRNLPRDGKADDIAAEIADDVQSRIEEREQELGRPLTSDEQIALLQAYGNPRTVAARYGRQQYLIWPTLFPAYTYALRVTLTVVIGLQILAGAIAALATHDASRYWSAMSHTVGTLFWAVGIVTILFIASERFGDGPAARFASRPWSPQSLPPASDRSYVSRFTSATDFIANIAVLLFFLWAMRTWPVIRGNPWASTVMAIVASCCIFALAAVLVYIRPYAGQWRRAGQVIGNLVVAGGLTITLCSVHIDNWLGATLGVVLVCVLIAAAVAAWSFVRYARVPVGAGA